MATLFGEVVHPKSRAFWIEDEDDETLENDESLPSFTVEWSQDKPMNINNLIVAETHMIIDFTKEYVIKNTDAICTVTSTISSDNNPSKLYKITDDLYIFVVNPDVDLSQTGDIVESITEILQKCNNITALTYKHISRLKTVEETSGPAFLRTLCTRKFSNQRKLSISTLKQPNFVAGVAAGVVAYAEVMDLSATLNVLYSDGFHFDSECAALLIKLFSDISDYKFGEYKSLNRKFFNKGNLYMYTKVILYYFLSLSTM